MTEYDLLMISDLRLTGGTTAGMAEEIRAQAAAGYRTALLHVNSSLTSAGPGVSAHLSPLVDDELATLVLPGDRIRARHAIVRHPAVAQEMTAGLTTVTVDGVSVIADHPVHDAAGAPQYDPARATENVVASLMVEPVWRPIGPAVRRQLADRPGIVLSSEDWRSVIDMDQWSVERTGPRRVPVLGRHGRSHWTKWPDRAEDILAAYPESDDVRVRVLGGTGPVLDVVGRVPPSWLVEPFGARRPSHFLADIDFFVYYHHPAWSEPSGRNILEAMASGAVVILPEHFRETYGDAAVYATPHQVRTVVDRLSTEPEAYVRQSKLGQEFIATHHGHQTHLDRVASLLGAPSAGGVPRRSGARSEERTRVLFVSSNGNGMGHLTRLLAMANRASEEIEPFFFSMSSAVPVVARYGYTWEYCPSRDDMDVTAKEWNPFFTKRFVEVVRRYRPRALVFDGTWPYRGLGEAQELFPDLLYIWSRRAMWKKGHRTDSLEKSAWFDLIIEPGEFAAEADVGPTTSRADARKVAPITLLDRDDVLSRDAARAELGMDPEEKAVLVTLGGGNASDLGSDLEAIADAVSRRPGWQVYATRPPIARAATSHEGVRPISVYPLCRILAAFDVAVVACGYNSYHESILAAVPTIFVPKAKVTDDQYARARYAEESGVGLSVDAVTVEAIAKAMDRVLDPEVAKQIRERCTQLYPGNGAADGMALIERLLTERGVLG